MTKLHYSPATGYSLNVSGHLRPLTIELIPGLSEIGCVAFSALLHFTKSRNQARMLAERFGALLEGKDFRRGFDVTQDEILIWIAREREFFRSQADLLEAARG